MNWQIIARWECIVLSLTHLSLDKIADDFFRGIFVNKKFCILIKISLKFILKGPMDNNTVLG